MTNRSAQAPDAIALTSRFQEETGIAIAAMLELSDRCNEVCVHCYQEQGKKGEMSTQEVFSLLDELAAQGVLMLTLSGGEVTLRKDFLEILEYAHKRRFMLRVFTNGLSMTAEMAAAFQRCAVATVEISVYSDQAEMHDFVTGVPGSFDKTVAGIRHLVAEGVAVVMKTPVMSINEDRMDEYRRFAAELGVAFSLGIQRLHAKEGGDRTPSTFDPSVTRALELRHDHTTGPTGAVPGPKPVAPDRQPCGAGRGIHVEANGELRPCAMLEVSLGNLREQSLADARANDETRNGLKSLRWSDLHGCRMCELGGHCARCYARSLRETGDALGPYPTACENAVRTHESDTGSKLGLEDADGNLPLGPYVFLSDGRCVSAPDVRTAEDEALAERLSWVRAERVMPRPANTGVRPGELIQLRRPGRKQAIKQRIPSGVQVGRHADT